MPCLVSFGEKVCFHGASTYASGHEQRSLLPYISFEPIANIDSEGLCFKKILPKRLEKNGLVILDVYPEKMKVRFYAWRQPDPVSAIDEFKPHHEITLKRRYWTFYEAISSGFLKYL